jgi:hypothetical protein
MNGKFVLDGKFVKGMKIRTHVPNSSLHEDHENRVRIGVGTWTDNNRFLQFLGQFSKFHFFEQRDDDKGEHWEEDYSRLKEWYGHGLHKRGEGSGEFGK